MTGPSQTTDKDADPVSAVHERAKEFEAHVLEHSRGAEAGDTVAGGHMARGAGKQDSNGSANGKKKSDDLTQAVIDATAAMERDLKRLYEEQERLYDRLSDLELKIDKLEQISDGIEHGRMPEIGSDGKLKDAELEAMVAAQEKRLGRAVDRSNPQALLAIFADEHERAVVERTETMEAINKVEADIEAVQNGRELDETLDTGLSGSKGFETSNATTHEVAEQIVTENGLDQFTL